MPLALRAAVRTGRLKLRFGVREIRHADQARLVRESHARGEWPQRYSRAPSRGRIAQGPQASLELCSTSITDRLNRMALPPNAQRRPGPVFPSFAMLWSFSTMPRRRTSRQKWLRRTQGKGEGRFLYADTLSRSVRCASWAEIRNWPAVHLVDLIRFSFNPCPRPQAGRAAQIASVGHRYAR